LLTYYLDKMNTKRNNWKYTPPQLTLLVTLRVIIGWHFLFEGLTKLINPDWSSYSFLLDSKWIFSGVFYAMAQNPGVLKVIDVLNVWGLIIIGFALIVGFFSRPAIISGIILLGLYYLSHPPLVGIRYEMPTEGKYLLVNKNLIELFALAVLYVFPTSRIIGLDRFLFGDPNIQKPNRT